MLSRQFLRKPNQHPGAGNTGQGNQCFFTLTSGVNNSGFGIESLKNLMNGNYNCAFGSQSLNALIAGDRNTAIGTSAGILLTGSRNTLIGIEAGSLLTASNDCIMIGNSGVLGDTNLIRIGANQSVCAIAGINGSTAPTGIPVLVSPGGVLGTVVSSERYKNNIQALSSDVSKKVYDMCVVEFYYNTDTDRVQYGMIAEEVAAVLPEIVVINVLFTKL